MKQILKNRYNRFECDLSDYGDRASPDKKDQLVHFWMKFLVNAIATMAFFNLKSY